MSFYIGCYWKPKGLSLEESALKITQFLNLLINPESKDLDSLQKWFEVASSKKAALAKPVVVENVNILNLIIKRNKLLKNNYLPQDLFSEVGFTISFWNGAVNPENEISIGFIIGASSPYITNSVVLRLPQKLITLGICKPIFEKMISFWDPQWAVLTSYEIANAINSANEVGILNFFDTSYSLPGSYSENMMVQKVENGIIISFLDSLWDKATKLDPVLLKDLKELHKYFTRPRAGL